MRGPVICYVTPFMRNWRFDAAGAILAEFPIQGNVFPGAGFNRQAIRIHTGGNTRISERPRCHILNGIPVTV